MLLCQTFMQLEILNSSKNFKNELGMADGISYVTQFLYNVHYKSRAVGILMLLCQTLILLLLYGY